MKRMFMVLMALSLVSAVAIAQTDVTSVNAVGFIRNTFGTGTWTMVQIPFDEMTAGAYTVSNVFGSSLPTNTEVWLWNKNTQQWKKESYGYSVISGTNKWTPGTNLLGAGIGVFMHLPANAALPNYTVSFNGEVPSDTNTPLALTAGFTFVGYPYPVSMLWTSTVLAATAKTGDVAWIWNTASNIWKKESYGYSVISGTNKWTPGTTLLTPGGSFFYQSSASAVKNEQKPYLWP